MNPENEFRDKVACFVKQAMADIEDLQGKLRQVEEKQAQEHEDFEKALRKAAQALYESDFINEEAGKKIFIKKASESPAYLASVIEKVCNAADVSLIGRPARVAARSKNAEYDPVMAKAFGWDNSTVLDDK